jgi:hypothetical protein
MSSESAARSPASPLPIVLIGVIVLGSIARLAWLDLLPGIDGDEAWYGVNVQVFRDGGVPFWRTGVGNSLNPFHSLPLLAMSYVMTTSATLLRAPEVAWGLLAMATAYPLFAGAIGRRGAVLATALLALSPTAIAYSRFGWDPSGTPLACVLALGFALRQQPVAAAISSLAAIVIHPTNIFVVPIVLSAFAPALHRRYLALALPARRRLQLGVALLVALVSPLALWVVDTLAARPNTTIPSVEIVLQRAFAPGAWAATATGALRMFSGTTTITDMVGRLPALAQAALDVAAIAVLVFPVLLALRRVRWARPDGDSAQRFLGGDRPQFVMWLSGGFLVSLAAFHIVGGPTALMPGRERYGLVFLVPEIVLCATAIDALWAAKALLSRAAMAIAVVSFTALTVYGYFVPLLTRGGDARPGLRTGVVEPKVAAFEFLKADAGSAEVIEVIADDWHLYWPMRYLAGRDKRFHLELTEGANAPGGLRPAGVPPEPYPHPPDRVYALVFDGGGEWRRLRELGLKPAFTALDPIGRPILHVVRVQQTEFRIQGR